MQLVHVSRWNLSHVSVRVRSVRAASSHNALKQNKTSSGKQVDKIYAHNRFVFYSCNRELRINLAVIPLLGNVAENKKISTVSPRSIYEFI